jgi:signal transduction histidine kinase/ActR/RegA family two-component response regulator
MSEATREREQLVLVLAPSGRDGPLAAAALERAQLPSLVCLDLPSLCREIRQGAGMVLLADEAVSGCSIEALRDLLAQQPPWSDLPIVMFTGRRSEAPGGGQGSPAELLGNVTTLERPVHPATLINAARAALRGRRRQYQMREILQRLETGVRQRDQFLAMLGHELRNPLAAIHNAVELAHLYGSPDERLGRPLAIVERQARHLTRLVDDLLDVSRVTSGKVTLQHRVVDIGALLRAVVQQVEPACRQRSLGLSLATTGEPGRVLGDPVRLEQVFSNLLTNAIKYTPLGGRIEVRLDVRDEDVDITVADTGVGIAAEALPHIFDLFNQAPPTLDRAQGGLGIGLTVVRSLVELHGGQVRPSSAGLGQGAQFMVRLPRTTAPVEDLNDADTEADDPHGRHILIIEDNADNRDSLRDLLEERGHRVDVASDGPQGIEEALRLRPEVALIDIGLPTLDGFEVARRLRRALGPDVFLIALTGYGQPEDKDLAKQAGFDAHLTKPMHPNDLERMLSAGAAVALH